MKNTNVAKKGDGQRVIKNLSQISALFPAAKQEKLAADMALTMNGSMPLPVLSEDSPSVAIWKIMSDYRGRTIDEVVEQLKSTEVDIELIAPTMKWLNNAGWFTKIQPASGSCIYTLKKGIPMPSPEHEKAASPKRRLEDLPHDINREGVICQSEGIDVSIWKAMSDRKPRTATEIGDILSEFGFDRVVIKDRAITLMRRGWFTRNERHGGTYYVMKKGIQMPKVVKPAAEEQLLRRSSDVVAKSGPVVRIVPNPTPGVVSKPTPPAPTLNMADGIFVSIWKVMSDYKPYTAAEIMLLLGEIGFNTNSVSARISQLNITYQWFDVTKIRGQRAVAYTLNKSIPMPTGPNLSDVVAAKTAMTNTTKSAQPVTEQKKEQPVKASASTANNQQRTFSVAIPTDGRPAKEDESAPVPLVEVSVRIKGTSLTFAEAEEITRQLIASGYSSNNSNGFQKTLLESPLFGVSVTIKGKQFTTNELREVVRQLQQAGFGKR